ncbi:MAG: FAD-binding oxidoreductase [Taibaiella sp.]|nr:FAD-binding oxidoreductase [Taibaiella sp.]
MNKREFLKLMGGISLGMLPLIGCYDEQKKSTQKAQQGPASDSTEGPDLPDITDEDILLFQKNDERYQTYVHLYNKRIARSPKYIAVCKTVKGVQYAVSLAGKEQIPVAIRSGGHSFEGFSSNDGGMMIHLGLMKTIRKNEEGSITIGSGITLSELHDQVYAAGRMIPAGSCGGVGIAGLTLGGGYGFFSRKYGLTCDSLTDAAIVTADGTVKSAKDDPELLWALKGGGNGSFGVVTDLTFKTYPLPKTFSSYTLKFRNLAAGKFMDLLSLWMKATGDLPKEGFGAFVLNGPTLTILFTTYNNADIHASIAALLDAADHQSRSLDKPLVQAIRRFYGRKDPLYFKNASCGYYNDFSEFEDIGESIFDKVVQHPGMIFQLNTLGAAINEIGNDATAYPHRDKLYLSELQAYYDRPDQEGRLLKAFEDIQQMVRNKGITAQYANYPDVHFRNWEQAYFGLNYPKLQGIKNRLDPRNLFRYEQSIRISQET